MKRKTSLIVWGAVLLLAAYGIYDLVREVRRSYTSCYAHTYSHAIGQMMGPRFDSLTPRGEIRDNLPLMADLSRKFPEHQFVVAGVAWLDRALYEQYMAGSGIRYVCDQTYETLAAAEAAVVTSGTATLETALLGIPEVVVYRTLWFQVRLRPYVLKVPWVSLVNLNLGREAVAEVIQSDLDTTRAERELRAIVAGGEKRGRMLADFAELRTVIGGPGASDRFAARMVAELRAPETK